ncbi:MAG TPA: CpsD/CapB family tyrosine-protein kinase, partial [Phycisphaerae bacterium]|nr:CpsD/CapB family tyrosine-protein kinase [Phycisphaerae bacterium]
AVGIKSRDFKQKSDDLAQLQKKVDDITDRMNTLLTEGSLGGRLSVINTGGAPLSPLIDQRPKYATLAGAFGFLLPAAVVFGLSFVRRRYRYVDDTARDSSLLNVPLLGMLPEVGRKFDPEVLHATAHGIHQMRVLLCAKAPRNSKRSYLITSATEGEGKTNLTVALGMSFAASRQRTLVIDCDFVGRRLTRGFKATECEGVYESIRDGSLGSRVRQEGPRFFVLPAGHVDSNDACSITADNIRDLLSQTRGQFDTVIIDTGPILGSLEAAIVAQEVDGVILAISRGQHPTLVQHALRRLESVKAVLAGAVFNRAKLQDFHSSAYTSSYTSQPFAESISMERAGESSIFADFGPLVRAVSLGTPAAA